MNPFQLIKNQLWQVWFFALLKVSTETTKITKHYLMQINNSLIAILPKSQKSQELFSSLHSRAVNGMVISCATIQQKFILILFRIRLGLTT